MILIGTDDGLLGLAEGGTRLLLDRPNVRAVDGDWAVAGDLVVALAGGQAVSLGGPTPLCVAALAEGSALVGTSGARLYRVSRAGEAEPVHGFDAIADRRDWYTPWGAPPDTRSVAIGQDGAWFVNVHVGGVWRSVDGGQSWWEVVAQERDTHQVIAAGTRMLVAAAAGFGASADGGDTWSWTVDGLHAPYARAVAQAGDFELVTASTGPGTDRAALYRRPAGSNAPFERCRTGVPEWFDHNVDTFQLAARDDTVLLGTPGGTLHRSDDAGRSFATAVEGLPPIRWVGFHASRAE